MHRVLVQLVFAMGVLIAAAIADLTPHAAAAYQPITVSTTQPISLDADWLVNDTASFEPFDPQPSEPFNKLLHGVHHPASAGGSMTLGSSSSSGSSSPTMMPASIELSPPNLIVYMREPSELFHLTAFITSILDPPRSF